jgi:hypothetical protein
VSEAAPDAVEYVPAAHAAHADWLVAAVELEYVPGLHAWQTEADLAFTSDDHVPALQLWNDDPPGTGQYAPEGQSRQSSADDDPLFVPYVPVAQGVGLMVPSLGQ